MQKETPPNITFASAATLSLEALADLFTRSFAEYFYPGATTVQTLANRVRSESIDLLSSPLILVDAEPAGIALLARRGERAWCAGFGICLPFRGRGLAYALAGELIARARDAGARRLTLEVLTRNTRALHVYLQAGLKITRRLLVFSWSPDDDEHGPVESLIEADPPELLAHFAALHPAPAAWQRDLPALLVQSGLHGLMLADTTPTGYVLVSGDAANTRIVDLGAGDPEAAYRLLGGLQARSSSLLSVNEPAESPLSAAFYRAGFLVADEQHEMEIEL